MRKTYQQIYRETQGLELDLTDMLGYGQEKRPIEQKEKKQLQHKDCRVAGITLRKFGKEIPQTDQMKQIDNELGALKNERLLREIRDKQQKEPSLEQKSAIILLMEEKIDEYNFIVDHKHLRKSYNQHDEEQKQPEVKSSLIHQETTIELIIKDIKRKKKQLINASLTQQISLNRHIAKLYKEYQKHSEGTSHQKTERTQSARSELYKSAPAKSLRKDFSGGRVDRLSHSLHPGKTSKKILAEQSSPELSPPPKHAYMTEQLVHKFKDKQYRRAQTTNRKRSDWTANSEQTQNFNREMREPYLNKQQMQKFKVMEGKITNTQDALEIWKGKVGEATMNASVAMQVTNSQQGKVFLQEEEDMRLRQTQFETVLTKELKLESWEEENTQHDIFSVVRPKAQVKPKRIDLQSPSNKFNRLWGKKMQIELGTDSNLSIRWSKAQSQPRSQSRGSISTPNTAFQSKRSRSRGTPARNSWQQEDQEHYQRMCKNQKMNLLLKRRRQA